MIYLWVRIVVSKYSIRTNGEKYLLTLIAFDFSVETWHNAIYRTFKLFVNININCKSTISFINYKLYNPIINQVIN